MSRRRPAKEIAFSFDSFLDLVANVVGIILRLILVVWVGARSYKVLVPPSKPLPTSPPIEDREWAKEIAHWRNRIKIELQQRDHAQSEYQQALARLGSFKLTKEELQRQKVAEEQKVKALQKQQRNLELEQAKLDARAKLLQQKSSGDPLLQELIQKRLQLRKDLASVKEKKVPKKVLRYQVPVAELVQTQELQFECRDKRVSFLDVAALFREIRTNIYNLADDLREQWKVEKRTAPVGAFRLKYTIVRERGLLDKLVGAGAPDEKSNFRYGLTRWVAEPVKDPRGETLSSALTEKSEFRDLIDHLDPKTTAVTFWVYPDSFPLYRKLRDHCVKKGIVVAGRPLPMDIPIASSKDGTASRGQ